jgi:tRNA threonylcarbamoyladenosine biosynthesis protein TsaE
MKEPFIVTESELYDLAKKITDTLSGIDTKQSKVLFLDGDLGAGKTTFTKELASVLGIAKEDVHSPTFILKKEYKTDHDSFKKLIHVDAYRFDSPKEGEVLKLHEDKEKEGSLIVVEWPSKLGGALKEDMVISFAVIDDDTREVTVNYTHEYFR